MVGGAGTTGRDSAAWEGVADAAGRCGEVSTATSGSAEARGRWALRETWRGRVVTAMVRDVKRERGWLGRERVCQVEWNGVVRREECCRFFVEGMESWRQDDVLGCSTHGLRANG